MCLQGDVALPLAGIQSAQARSQQATRAGRAGASGNGNGNGNGWGWGWG